MIIIAMADIHDWGEIFIHYGATYWEDKLDKLSVEQAARVRDLLGKQGQRDERRRLMMARSMDAAELELQAPRVRRAVVRSRLEQLSDIKREKYVVDNVEQSKQLADKLQYLVGKVFYDDDNGHQYEV